MPGRANRHPRLSCELLRTHRECCSGLISTFQKSCSTGGNNHRKRHRLCGETKNDRSTGSARERHGLFRCGAFQAARIRRPSIQYSRVVLPPGPNSWPLNIPAAYSVPARTAAFSYLAQQCGPFLAQQCGPFATYRRLTPSPASMICRCITAIISDGTRAQSSRVTLRGGFHGPLPVLHRFGGLVMTITSLKWSQKAFFFLC